MSFFEDGGKGRGAVNSLAPGEKAMRTTDIFPIELSELRGPCQARPEVPGGKIKLINSLEWMGR